MQELIVLAAALAADAAAASAGLAAAGRSVKTVAIASALFALFQGGMAGAGWWFGRWIVAFAAAWDHWVAFVLLAGLGARMAYIGWRGDDDDAPPPDEKASWGAIVGLAFATSVDALAAGLTLPALGVGPLAAIGVIAGVTAALSLLAGVLGTRVGHHFGPRVEIVAGLVLIAIGAKILVEHLTAAG